MSIICEIRDERGSDPSYGWEIRISGIPELQGEGNYHWLCLAEKQKDVAELIGALCELLRKERDPNGRHAVYNVKRIER